MASPNRHFALRYIIYALVSITIVLAAIFVSHQARIEKLTDKMMLQQARALYGELILTRKWINLHGGVYVKVQPGVEPNPFLTSQIGVKANLTADNGNQYTLINPAIAVREISEISEKEGAFKLHVASLDPVSPASRQADDFERKALLAFERGKEEIFAVEESEQGSFYRYMAPVKFEQSCNKCHAFQKLKQGDIRGGISISIPMTEVRQELVDTRYFSLYSAILVLGSLLAILGLISNKFMAQLKIAQSELELSATTDSLTELFNRKTAYNRLAEELSKNKRYQHPLSCLMLDVDHFKRINDHYGHLVGDKVLKQLAVHLLKLSRSYDILCRYGGEEFFIILPQTDLQTATQVAERYRQEISALAIKIGKQKLHITVSIGATEAYPENTESRDSLIGRADAALYQAKDRGRNQVVTIK